MAVVEEKILAGLVLECVAPSSEWASHVWRPVTVFPVAPPVAPWTPLGATPSARRYYAGTVGIDLYSTDTANYRDNLESETPKLWVVLRADGEEPPVEIVLVTADPAEGEAHTEAGTNTVETVAMPNEVAAEIAQFIAANHVERPVIKRKRDRAEPDVRWRDGRGGDRGRNE